MIEKNPAITNEVLDLHLDLILKASGSALRHIDSKAALDKMREAMKRAMEIEIDLLCEGEGGHMRIETGGKWYKITAREIDAA